MRSSAARQLCTTPRAPGDFCLASYLALCMSNVLLGYPCAVQNLNLVTADHNRDVKSILDGSYEYGTRV